MPVITEITLLKDINASIDFIETDTTNIAYDSALIDTKIGEVDANPTQYTVLERLKNIETNTSGGGSIPVYKQNFSQAIDWFIRPADTTTYLPLDCINTDSFIHEKRLITMPGIYGTQYVKINSIVITTDNLIPLDCWIFIYPNPNDLGCLTTDNVPFNPTIGDAMAISGMLDTTTWTSYPSTGITLIKSQANLNITVPLSNSINGVGVMYTLVTKNAYIPLSGQIFSVFVNYELI